MHSFHVDLAHLEALRSDLDSTVSQFDPSGVSGSSLDAGSGRISGALREFERSWDEVTDAITTNSKSISKQLFKVAENYLLADALAGKVDLSAVGSRLAELADRYKPSDAQIALLTMSVGKMFLKQVMRGMPGANLVLLSVDAGKTIGAGGAYGLSDSRTLETALTGFGATAITMLTPSAIYATNSVAAGALISGAGSGGLGAVGAGASAGPVGLMLTAAGLGSYYGTKTIFKATGGDDAFVNRSGAGKKLKRIATEAGKPVTKDDIERLSRQTEAQRKARMRKLEKDNEYIKSKQGLGALKFWE